MRLQMKYEAGDLVYNIEHGKISEVKIIEINSMFVNIVRLARSDYGFWESEFCLARDYILLTEGENDEG